ncbi:ribonucleases P/MRP protein subunit POP1 [Phymastichus coffea]|uniref:ribonucleases P/MRP protein subunit POP1 n=1 Tax=Phymastichus coffea TaxID=108790 RepID=UPI00273B0BB2|nr:ribonucleases P/MRP protein subunit POP1 [Phymastichus coffea]
MSKEKQQFDVSLGGEERLPRDASFKNLATARANEMAAMTYNLEHPNQTKLIFQKLPMHMRRRVMSHNAKRMPRKLRNGHISQMTKSGLPPKTKRPSRKFRRRPCNLLLEYNRRQKNKFWLETHIWHAKRFKMIEKWGFKLPYHSNDRCFRANYRAVVNHCLIQDISYYTCIEIKGPEELLKEKLKMHCNPNELTFCAKAFINGEREGTVMFYEKNSCPTHPIGYVNFLWRPTSKNNIKAIWIWIHPSFYEELLNSIISNFDFELKKSKSILDAESDCSQEKLNSQDQENVETGLKIFLFTKIPVYENSHGCELVVLRNCLNRFRLSGPLALSILTDAFKIPNINSKLNNVQTKKTVMEIKNSENVNCENVGDSYEMEVDNIDKTEHSIDSWYKSYYESQDNLQAFNIQNKVYNNISNLKTPNQLPPNMVLALTVLDPRFFLPNKRTKSLPNTKDNEIISMIPSLLNQSPLYDKNIRSYVTKNCISASAINSIRSQSLVPGVENDQFFNEDIMHKVPILLIQKPGSHVHNNNIGFGAGIDIILPASWSMPFWLALILRCAKPGGLREAKSIAYENSNLSMPALNHPDTNAFKIEADIIKKELTKKYFKLPPNKRVNYVKFGISSPFFCEWNMLMKEWNNVDDFYVLKDHNVLSLLRAKLCSKTKKKNKVTNKELNEESTTVNLDNLVDNKNCFVPVRVIIERKGLPHDFSIICLPTEQDLIKLIEDPRWCGPEDSIKTDPNEEKRKNLRKDHLTHLKRLRKQRVRAKKKIKAASYEIPLENSSEAKHLNKICQLVKEKLSDVNKTIIEQQSNTMANLFLPKCAAVRHSCDREVIGYVTQGGFSFSEAKGVGLGYVVFSTVLELVNKNSNIVLTRNTTTRKYSICQLDVLTC